MFWTITATKTGKNVTCMALFHIFLGPSENSCNKKPEKLISKDTMHSSFQHAALSMKVADMKKFLKDRNLPCPSTNKNSAIIDVVAARMLQEHVAATAATVGTSGALHPTASGSVTLSTVPASGLATAVRVG